MPDNAIRAMIHVTIRRKSWTDLAEHIAFSLPEVVRKYINHVMVLGHTRACMLLGCRIIVTFVDAQCLVVVNNTPILNH